MDEWNRYVFGVVSISDGGIPGSIWSVNPTGLEGPMMKPGTRHAIRPVNMSVVWIMRVK